MGGLLSRVFRRLTQAAQPEPERPQQPRGQRIGGPSAREQEPYKPDPATAHARAQQEDRRLVQSIPVGQSIDSAEMGVHERPTLAPSAALTTQGVSETAEDAQPADEQAATPPSSPQLVEEAAIKIQALVRGHLTRKALAQRDGQFGREREPLSTLGQSQFDADTLMKGAPSAVFLDGAPLTVNLANLHQQAEATAATVKLPPISESEGDAPTETELSAKRHQLRPSSSSPSKLTMPSGEGACMRPDSASPALSEAAASIELGAAHRPDSPTASAADCESPTLSVGASIDIADHGADSGHMAAILHPHPSVQAPATAPQAEPVATDPVATLTNGGSLVAPAEQQHQMSLGEQTLNGGQPDSEVAAAIKIQSAFRGYRTRKYSPYRARSPSAPLSGAYMHHHNEHHTEAALGSAPIENGARMGELPELGRRSSRARERSPAAVEGDDNEQEGQEAPSVTEDPSVSTVVSTGPALDFAPASEASEAPSGAAQPPQAAPRSHSEAHDSHEAPSEVSEATLGANLTLSDPATPGQVAPAEQQLPADEGGYEFDDEPATLREVAELVDEPAEGGADAGDSSSGEGDSDQEQQQHGQPQSPQPSQAGKRRRNRHRGRNKGRH